MPLDQVTDDPSVQADREHLRDPGFALGNEHGSGARRSLIYLRYD